MVLSLANAPTHGFDIVNRNVGSYSGAFVSFRSEAKEKSFIARPQPLYTADVDALERHGLLQSASLTGWVYVIFTGETPEAVVELAVNVESDDGLSFATLHPRSTAEHLVRTIAEAEKLADAKKKLSYDLKLLRLPELYLLAVWLSGKDDLLLPVSTKIPKLTRKGVFSERALTKVLLPLAKIRQDAIDREIMEDAQPIERSAPREAEYGHE